MYSHITFAAGVLLLTLASISLIGNESNRSEGLARAQSGNFMAYQGAVRAYIENRPGHSGEINVSDLDLPRTFFNMGWSSQADAGVAWVYGDMTASGLRQAVDLTEGAINIGRKENGWLVSPVHGHTGIPVPDFIVDGQVVVVIVNL